MVNKTFVKVGISIILAGVVLSVLGLVEKISYENCLQRESGMLCASDPENRFFFAALPVGVVGILIFVMGIRDLTLLPSSKPPLE